ncbi:synaptojanin-2-binding protein [Octopus sinensis]|uniref:Synaptojanin-2-binding protein n=1 Tax=Octopus sinensis TaxID=2607531 RepID=A0A6P7SHM9_9MOLL|nr:synaptojanin-2-binding protein [Octopus sinensis]XP_036360057.1 synaptojanin-2-binding protein [Octopus sinensis]
MSLKPTDMDLPIDEIVLYRDEHVGLGFNIRGGIDMPLAWDTGIFVARIKEKEAADIDGRLEEGDKILEVNGQSLENLPHSEAVKIFLSAGNVVKLKVQHGAMDNLVKAANRKIDHDKKQSMTDYIYPALLLVTGIAVLSAGAFFVHKRFFNR